MIEGRLITGNSTNMNDMPDNDQLETGSIGDHEEKTHTVPSKLPPPPEEEEKKQRFGSFLSIL